MSQPSNRPHLPINKEIEYEVEDSLPELSVYELTLMVQAAQSSRFPDPNGMLGILNANRNSAWALLDQSQADILRIARLRRLHDIGYLQLAYHPATPSCPKMSLTPRGEIALSVLLSMLEEIGLTSRELGPLYRPMYPKRNPPASPNPPAKA